MFAITDGWRLTASTIEVPQDHSVHFKVLPRGFDVNILWSYGTSVVLAVSRHPSISPLSFMAQILNRRVKQNDEFTDTSLRCHARSFGIELHGGVLGLGLGARELIDYTAEFGSWSSESKPALVPTATQRRYLPETQPLPCLPLSPLPIKYQTYMSFPAPIWCAHPSWL